MSQAGIASSASISSIPVPISQGGTNATSFSTTNGVVTYNGSSLVSSSAVTLVAGGISAINSQPSSYQLFLQNSSVANGSSGGATFAGQSRSFIFFEDMDGPSTWAIGTGGTGSFYLSPTNTSPSTTPAFVVTAAGTPSFPLAPLGISSGGTGVTTIPTGQLLYNSAGAPNAFIACSFVTTYSCANGTTTVNWTTPLGPSGQETFAFLITINFTGSGSAGGGTYSLKTVYLLTTVLQTGASITLNNSTTTLATHGANNGYTSVVSLTGGTTSTLTVQITNTTTNDKLSISSRVIGDNFGNY